MIVVLERLVSKKQKVFNISDLLPLKGCTNHDKGKQVVGQCRVAMLDNVGL